MISETGELSVLSCGRGDMRITIDKDKPEDVAKAKRVITDMLTRGYTILIEVDGTTKKVKRFDPEHNEYIIEEPPATGKRKGGRPKGVPMAKAKATGIGRTAGG